MTLVLFTNSLEFGKGSCMLLRLSPRIFLLRLLLGDKIPFWLDRWADDHPFAVIYHELQVCAKDADAK